MGNPGNYIPESGMTQSHFEAFREAAKQEGVVVVVRNTNMASVPLIERGCPGKPFEIKFNTDKITGVVTALNADEIALARRSGFAVIDRDGIARGQRGSFRVDNAFWKVAPGQVLEYSSRKPLVGDYDLMGVFEPNSPGRNIALATKNGNAVANVSSPIVQRFAMRVNATLDRPRVLHGAQDQFGSFKGGATAFMPDGGTVLLRDEGAVSFFYSQWRRETRMGSYNPTPTVPEHVRRGMIEERPSVPRFPTPAPSEPFSGRARNLLRNQDAVAFLGAALEGLMMSIGDLGIQRRIQNELETTLAPAIERILSRGDGVLVIVRMQEWAMPDFNGHKARALVGVYVEGGPTFEAAKRSWQDTPKLMQGSWEGWAMRTEEYHWIPPQGSSRLP